MGDVPELGRSNDSHRVLLCVRRAGRPSCLLHLQTPGEQAVPLHRPGVPHQAVRQPHAPDPATLAQQHRQVSLASCESVWK